MSEKCIDGEEIEWNTDERTMAQVLGVSEDEGKELQKVLMNEEEDKSPPEVIKKVVETDELSNSQKVLALISFDSMRMVPEEVAVVERIRRLSDDVMTIDNYDKKNAAVKAAIMALIKPTPPDLGVGLLENVKHEIQDNRMDDVMEAMEENIAALEESGDSNGMFR